MSDLNDFADDAIYMADDEHLPRAIGWFCTLILCAAVADWILRRAGVAL
jgi:hypothetical protein